MKSRSELTTTTASITSRVRARGMVFLLSLFAANVLGNACANPNQPPGGPPDTDAPVVMKVTPTNGSMGPRPKSVTFQFDEVISETPKGAMDLGKIVFISPKSGETEVNWKRSQLEIKPKSGWKPNTVYTVLLGAGVTDLRNNSIDSATRIVFSTGGAIPQTKIEGVAFDWLVGRFAPKAIVEAIAKDVARDTSRTGRRDSTIYQTMADSLGRYSLEHVPPGNYTLRAFIDRNNNQTLERLEPWDTTSISLTSNANAELYTFTHDSVGVRIQAVAVTDSNKTLRIVFGSPISPTQTLSSTQFLLRKREGRDTTTTLGISTVLTAPQRALFDSLKRKSEQDSLAKLRPPPDTSLAARTQRDSMERARRRDSVNTVERQKIEDRRLLALRGGRPLPAKDTTPQPKMKRAPLVTEVFVNLEQPLEYDGKYVLVVRTIRALDGIVKSPTAPVNVGPKPKPPEEKKAPGDTATTVSIQAKR